MKMIWMGYLAETNLLIVKDKELIMSITQGVNTKYVIEQVLLLWQWEEPDLKQMCEISFTSDQEMF